VGVAGVAWAAGVLAMLTIAVGGKHAPFEPEFIAASLR